MSMSMLCLPCSELFTLPSSYGTAYVGHTVSASVSISAPPASEVSLTPSGTGLTFSPAVLHFTSDGALTQSVSVWGAQAGSMQVVYEVGGADASDFVAPGPGSIEFLALGACAHLFCLLRLRVL